MGSNAIKLAEYLMQKYPLADNYPYKSWSYPQGFYLWGIIRLFEKTGDRKYYDYVLAYGNAHVNEDGTIAEFMGDCLDDIMPASVLIWLYVKTKEDRFKQAADKVRRTFDTYPRNSEGGFLHGKHLPGEMWADGLFMELMFLVRYGKYIGDEEGSYKEAIKQLRLFFEKAGKDKTGFVYHAYSENPGTRWASPLNGCSPEVWSEGLGWYGMALVETLGIIPDSFEGRQEIENQLLLLCEDLLKTQDWNCGLWYQVVDKQGFPRNFHDTSGSAMFVYILKKAYDLSLIENEYAKEVIEKGYRAILSKCFAGLDGGYNIIDACDGVCVQNNYDQYVDYTKCVNAKEAVAAVLWALVVLEEGTDTV